MYFDARAAKLRQPGDYLVVLACVWVLLNQARRGLTAIKTRCLWQFLLWFPGTPTGSFVGLLRRHCTALVLGGARGVVGCSRKQPSTPGYGSWLGCRALRRHGSTGFSAATGNPSLASRMTLRSAAGSPLPVNRSSG